jgi:uncharacterized protein (TIGR02300 family)
VAKPEWGVKRICPSCGARYYDLRRDTPVCPVCGTQYDPEALLKSRRARPVPVEDVKKAPPPVRDDDIEPGIEEDEAVDLVEAEEGLVAEDLEEPVEEGAEDEENVLIEDTSELGEEDIEVVDVEGEDEEER